MLGLGSYLFSSQVCHHQIRTLGISHFHLHMAEQTSRESKSHGAFKHPSSVRHQSRLFYLILEVLLHSKQISNFLVVDLKERCLKRTKLYLTFFTRRTIFVTNLKFVLPVLLLQPLLCLKYLLDCPAKYSIVSQYLHLNFTTFKAYLGIIP